MNEQQSALHGIAQDILLVIQDWQDGLITNKSLLDLLDEGCDSLMVTASLTVVNDSDSLNKKKIPDHVKLQKALVELDLA